MTCFLITTPKLGILFDSYFMYQYMSQLEQGNPRFPRKEDFLWYLIVVGTTILVGLFFYCLLAASRDMYTQNTPHHICPNSALPLQLLRFLEMRKITPALPLDPLHSQSFGLAGGVGMVGCLMDGSCDYPFA